MKAIQIVLIVIVVAAVILGVGGILFLGFAAVAALWFDAKQTGAGAFEIGFGAIILGACLFIVFGPVCSAVDVE